jgi:hypothetical protein
MAEIKRKYLYLAFYNEWERDSNGYTYIFEVGHPEKLNINNDRHRSTLKQKTADAKPEAVTSHF